MESPSCPKCKHAMDTGHISNSDAPGYVSDQQTGMLRQQTKITRSLACPNCGYVELYLDPRELKSRLK